jgi:beta-glucosidase
MDTKEKARELVSQMTLDEKVSLCSGKNFWYLKNIDRHGLPEIMVTDGPHGLRKQETSANDIGLNASVPSTCFPTASAAACSFDRQLLFEVGKAIAEECRQENVAVLLGPGINIKRSPLCGRNFEYFSEDPLVSGELAAAFIEGVQSQDVGVSLKHFAVNNQETRRMTNESVLDDRTFREIYLKGFEIAVKKARPWTVMCSYNRLFGEFASQNERLLNGILREEWGFNGVVVSDWGATVDRVAALRAGLDLEMPHIDDAHDMEIIKAVKSGILAIEKVDQAAENVVELILKSAQRKPLHYGQPDHHALARSLAAQSAVLLKNEGNLLPGRIDAKTAIIGAFAKNPRYQGTGSSKILPYKLDDPFDELVALGVSAEYAEGYPMETDEVDEKLIQKACDTAKRKDIVYLFAGLPDRYESEGFDRDSMRMPENHVRLIEAVSTVNKNVVVILMGGAPMEIPWIDKVSAVLLMFLGGQAVGGACADILTGRVNPCGKLAESWSLKLEDNPTFNYFPGYPLTVEYREGIFVGYRYYDTAQLPVRFPFGFGLSYTRFEYSDIKLDKKNFDENEVILISCIVKNTGKVEGKEVVQLYTAKKKSSIFRPLQELKGFQKISLKPGEQKKVEFSLPVKELAFYNTEGSTWQVEEGEYDVRIGSSSRDIRLTEEIQVASKNPHPLPDMRQLTPGYFDLSHGIHVTDKEFEALIGRPLPSRERAKGTPHTINSTFSDIKDKWVGRQILKFVNKQLENMSKDNADLKIMAEKMLMDSPLRLIATMGGSMTTTQLYGLVDLLNGHMIKGLFKLLKK